MVATIQANNKLAAAVDCTMQYYALFRYPLQLHEIHRSCQLACSEEDISEYILGQVEDGELYSYDNYFSTLSDVQALVERRTLGSEKARTELVRAKKVGRLIYQFPFVKFVGISGSLSKGYSDDRADFDFFIITKKERLWIARTLLHLFKKMTFLFGQQHKFCMNYFIDESALLLEERNVYTATELSSLIPVCGTGVYNELMAANNWIWNLRPNQQPVTVADITDKGSLIKTIVSSVINTVKPAAVNAFFMRLTDRKWRKKWAVKGYPLEDYDLAFKTRLNISKNHPANYQKRILEALTGKDK